MDRIRNGDAIPTIHAEIIPPQPAASSRSRAARTIDVYPEFAAPLRPPMRPRYTNGRKGVRRALWMAIGFSAFAVALLALRGPILTMLPAASGVYQAAGIAPVPTGPALEDVRLIRIFGRGAVSLNLEGVLANPTGRQIVVPPMSLVIQDAAGGVLQTIDIAIAPATLNPGVTTRFAAEISDPPEAMAAMAIRLGDGPLQPIAID